MHKELSGNYYELGSESATEIAVKQTIDGDRYSWNCRALSITPYGVYMAPQIARLNQTRSKVIFLPMHVVDEIHISYAEQDKR